MVFIYCISCSSVPFSRQLCGLFVGFLMLRLFVCRLHETCFLQLEECSSSCLIWCKWLVIVFPIFSSQAVLQHHIWWDESVEECVYRADSTWNSVSVLFSLFFICLFLWPYQSSCQLRVRGGWGVYVNWSLTEWLEIFSFILIMKLDLWCSLVVFVASTMPN